MKLPGTPDNERQRLERLGRTCLLDTHAEEIFDGFTRLAAAITGYPVAAISLIDENRQWFKSAVGMRQAFHTPRGIAFCAHTICQRTMLEVPDAREDERFRDNPLVTGEPHIVAYAGVPLVLPGDFAIGAICIIGYAPSRLTRVQHHLLRELAGQVVRVILQREDQHRMTCEMREAIEAADRAIEAKSAFLATMSHELRTPLNGVIGLAKLLANSTIATTQADTVRMIENCAKSLLGLVDDILDLSKIEAGQLTLEWVPTDLHTLVQEVVDVFAARASDKGIGVEQHISATVPRWIQCDPGRLRQILINLMSNALKFTTQGGFGIEVTKGPNEALRVAVSDSGIGIAPADQAFLFTRYTQIDSSSTRRYEGTGLGLAISRQLAQLMGGDITLVSELGLGSKFTVTVPLLPAKPQAADLQATNSLPRPQARLLLVEDNDVNQLVAQHFLKQLGYRSVTTVSNGAEALHACEVNAYDLILMDCQMPVMDGWEASVRLRDKGVTTPIMALTTSVTSDERERCFACGMDDFLSKPVDLQLLSRKIERLLARAGAPAAASSAPLSSSARRLLTRWSKGARGLSSRFRKVNSKAQHVVQRRGSSYSEGRVLAAPAQAQR